VSAMEAGKTTFQTWRKAPSQVSFFGNWFDLSMSSGVPKPQYYVGGQAESTALAYSTNSGLFVGAQGGTTPKYLRRFMSITSAAGAVPLTGILMDYLMFYPLIVEDTTEQQDFVNTITLPRYADGAGNQIMAVSTAPRTGGQSFYVTYTNQDGVTNRVSKTCVQNTITALGSVVTSERATLNQTGPFVPLQDGDTGVRSVESLTMLGADVGLMAIVIVHPLAPFSIFEQTAPAEIDFWTDKNLLPKIEDDAYLNMIVCPTGSLAATQLHGFIETVWE
jgi:hypothetical protein